MACTKYRNLISAYIDGETSGLEEEALLKHLDVCTDCKLEMKNMSLMSASIEESYEANVEINISSAIMGSIYDMQPEKRNSIYKIAQSVYRPVAVAASVAVMASVIYIGATSNETVASNSPEMEAVETLVMEHMDRAAVAERYLPEVTFASYDR